MNITRELTARTATVAALLCLAGCGGGDAKRLQEENTALRAEVEALRSQVAPPDAEAARAAELKRLEAAAQDAARLRGEVTQLRTAARDADKLRTENQQLRAENQKLRGAAAPAEPVPSAAAPPGSFPRAAWSMAGYASPEAALVTAIHAMQQGNPKQYFDSLTPEEQLRMTKVWEGKSPEEIAAKHVSDTAPITGLKVTQTQPVNADESLLTVFIEGANREEVVRMKRVGNDWKFGGYIRPAPKP